MLPTNYQNEVLNAAMSNRRQYRMIENNNGTVSFVDVTVYDQEGSLFDADDVNAFATAINLNINNIEAVREVLRTGVVNGIKGSAETGDFRVGQVTISAADVGTLTETEIRALISGGGGIHYVLVDELPTTDISTSTIYLVPSTNSRSRNVKDEYINLDGTTEGWEQIGSTSVNLTNYYTKTEIDSGALISVAEFQAM